MSRITGLHTYEAFRNVADEIVGYGTTLEWERVPDGEGGSYLRRSGATLNYFRPSQIAERIARTWFTASPILSRPELCQAIMLLEDEDQRGYALEAIGALARDGQEVPPAQERMQQIKNLAGHKGLASPAGFGTPAQPALELLPPMTEPREKFEAELEQLRQGKGRRGQVGTLNTFFESQEA